MKRIAWGLIFVILLAYTVSASANVGGYAELGAGNWDMPETFTGYGPDDVVAIAEKQENKGRSTLGYNGDWCAAFVNDVFLLAGQGNAAPFVSGVTHAVSGLRSKVIDSGGMPVSASEKRKGDLIFYYCNVCGCYTHVGICYDDTGMRIEGNVGGICKKYSSTYVHQWKNEQENTVGYHYEYLGEITLEYIRPNYDNSKMKLLHSFVYNDSFYAAVYEDLRLMSKYNRIQHWLNQGISEGRCASPVFDIMYYMDSNRDLQNEFGENKVSYINHYVDNGFREGRKASFFLDPQFYRASHKDLIDAFGNDYEKLIRHFLDTGISEYRGCSSVHFSLDHYRDNYLDLQNAFGTSPNDAITYIVHYLAYGSAEGRITDHRLKVFFEANGGMVDVESKDISSGGLYGDLPIPQREGYSFLGWFTEATGGQLVTADTIYRSLYDSSLYAQWNRNNTVTKAEVILPMNMTVIENSAFEGDTQIVSVDASNCTSIGDNAFLGCTELEWIRLPMNCEIGKDAFFGTALNTIYGHAGGTTETWATDHGIQFVAEEPEVHEAIVEQE